MRPDLDGPPPLRSKLNETSTMTCAGPRKQIRARTSSSWQERMSGGWGHHRRQRSMTAGDNGGHSWRVTRRPFYHVQTTDEPQTIPFVPLEITFDDMNLAMSMEWNVGVYGLRGDHFTSAAALLHCQPRDVTCYLCLSWDFELPE